MPSPVMSPTGAGADTSGLDTSFQVVWSFTTCSRGAGGLQRGEGDFWRRKTQGRLLCPGSSVEASVDSLRAQRPRALPSLHVRPCSIPTGLQ